MMHQTIITTDTIQSVVEHMNDDHADACLIIVQTLGKTQTAFAASMTGMDEAGVDFTAHTSEGKTEQVRVLFDKAVTRESQIRGHIVALTKRARAMQNNGEL